MNSKYSNLLTILLIVIIIAIVAIIAFLGYKFYETYITKSEAEEFVETTWGDSVENDTNYTPDSGNISTDNNTDNSTTDEDMFAGVDEGENNGNASSGGTVKKYNGFVVSGTIEIPATNLKCPIIAQSEYSPKALETSVVQIYGPGLNQVGNTTISGHNYRNGTFFSNNKKLKIGDKIFITDLTGKRLSYTIYDKFEAEDNYSDYMVRDTQGAIEISLSTCTDDSKARIIILARADV